MVDVLCSVDIVSFEVADYWFFYFPLLLPSDVFDVAVFYSVSQTDRAKLADWALFPVTLLWCWPETSNVCRDLTAHVAGVWFTSSPLNPSCTGLASFGLGSLWQEFTVYRSKILSFNQGLNTAALSQRYWVSIWLRQKMLNGWFWLYIICMDRNYDLFRFDRKQNALVETCWIFLEEQNLWQL